MPNLDLPEGLTFSDQHTVMLDLPALTVLDVVGVGVEDDLYFGKTERLKFAQGAVAEKGAHVTLLSGLLPLGNAYKRTVNAVLRGWEPEPVKITNVSFFPSAVEGEDYNTIIAHVEASTNLLDARARLEVLDYSATYPDYRPHATLAYIKGSADLETWVSALDKYYAGRSNQPTGLNLGHNA